MSARAMTFWTFVVTSVAVFMVSLDNLVVTTALPVIKADLGASLSGLEWTVNAYTLTFAVLLLTGAALGDRFGRKRMFLVGLAVFTAGSAAAALAPSIDALVAARALQGVGGAIVTPLTLTILSAAVPPARRGMALGIWGGVSGLAVALGPVVGGAIVEGLSLAVDLLAQRPDRPGAAADRADAADRVQGPEPLARPARSGPGQRRPARHRLGSGARQRARLDQPRCGRPHRRRHRPAGRVRPLGAAHAGADGAAALLPQPRLLGGQRHLAADELRDVRLDLPAGAVLPGGAGLLAAGGRAAHAAVDGHADLRRAHRRPVQRPHRRPSAAGRRHGADGGRAGVDRHRHQPDGRLRGARPRLRDGRRRHEPVLRAGRQPGAEHRAAQGGGQGERREQHHPRGRRRVRRRGAGERVQRRGRLR